MTITEIRNYKIQVTDKKKIEEKRGRKFYRFVQWNY